MESEAPLEYETGFPILVDCTCNGLQHLAALMSDVELTRDTNILDDSNGPKDLYSKVAHEINTTFKSSGWKLSRSSKSARDNFNPTSMPLATSKLGNNLVAICQHVRTKD